MQLVLMLAIAGCVGEDQYPNRPITIVCPWGAGGGTDRVSQQVAVHFEKELGVPVSVINATGGKGVTGHSRGLLARPDGYTIAMITLELNMMHWSGLTDLTYDDCIPLMSLNEDYAALFVRNDAPWESLSELEAEIRKNPGKLTASGTASGGAWHLALAGWLIASDMKANDVNWISSTGAGPSLQELMAGGLDLVCCSLPEARTLLESGQVRALGVMSPSRAKGFEDVKTFDEQGTDWTLGGWRGLAVPKGTPKDVVDKLVSSCRKIVTGETAIVTHDNSHGITFPKFMEQQRFDHTWRPPAEFRRFLAETDEKLGKLLTSEAMRSVNRDRYNAMMLPNILLGLLGLTAIALAVQRFLPARATEPIDDDHFLGTSRLGTVNFAAIALAVAIYVLLAETVGFILIAGFILFALLWWLGTRFWVSATITVLFVPVVYEMFAILLRVPLPRGWLGW